MRYADNGEPVPGAGVTVGASQQEFGGSMIVVAGKTDDRGRYRSNPKPGIRFGVTAYPPRGTAYLPCQTRAADGIRWQAGERVKRVDVLLPRGVLVHGKVVEAETGTPITQAIVQYVPERSNNPHASADTLPGWQASQLSGENGAFSLAVLPGPERLLVHLPDGNYVLHEIGGRELDRGQPGGVRHYAHAIAKINPAVGTDAIDVTCELQKGASVRGRIVALGGWTSRQPARGNGLRMQIFSRISTRRTTRI